MSHNRATTDPQVLEAMGRPETYPHPVESIEHLQTHISHLFLTGQRVYKLKKPVDLGFLNFSSLEDRLRYCRRELELNRRLAPSIYREVMALVRGRRGIRLEPLGEEPPPGLLEPCLCMVQMDRSRQMDRLLDQDLVEADQVRALARHLAAFYAQADSGPQVEFMGRWQQVRINVEENFRQTEAYQEVTVSPARWRAIRDYSLEFLLAKREIFQRRAAQGLIRDCHGDLHSGNINLPAQGKPIIFDCIEFNQRFRCQDVACDLAFLAMDLDYRGRPDLSRELVEEYVRASGDQGVWELLDFFKCYRAMVRAKVYGFEVDDVDFPLEQKFTDLDKAKDHFRLAARYAGGEPPYYLVCLMGVMASGKSRLAQELSRSTGWLRVNSDEVRKRLAGLDPATRSYDDWGQGLYGPQATRATYEALLEIAQARLALGDSLILDASFGKRDWRQRMVELALSLGARPLLVEVAAQRSVLEERLARREANGSSVSDGRLALLDRQLEAWEDAGDELAAHGLRVDGGAPMESKLAQVLERLRNP